MAPAPPTSFGWEAPGAARVFASGIAHRNPPAPVASVEMSEPRAGGPNATSDALAGTQWEILMIDEEPVIVGEAPLVITFGHDGRVSGTTGVNQLTASYSLTAEYLTFGPLATTRRAGPPELMAQERRVVASLAGMSPFRLAARTLSIDGPMGRIELATTDPLPAGPAPGDEPGSDPTSDPGG